MEEFKRPKDITYQGELHEFHGDYAYMKTDGKLTRCQLSADCAIVEDFGPAEFVFGPWIAEDNRTALVEAEDKLYKIDLTTRTRTMVADARTILRYAMAGERIYFLTPSTFGGVLSTGEPHAEPLKNRAPSGNMLLTGQGSTLGLWYETTETISGVVLQDGEKPAEAYLYPSSSTRDLKRVFWSDSAVYFTTHQKDIYSNEVSVWSCPRGGKCGINASVYDASYQDAKLELTAVDFYTLGSSGRFYTKSAGSAVISVRGGGARDIEVLDGWNSVDKLHWHNGMLYGADAEHIYKHAM